MHSPDLGRWLDWLDLLDWLAEEPLLLLRGQLRLANTGPRTSPELPHRLATRTWPPYGRAEHCGDTA